MIFKTCSFSIRGGSINLSSSNQIYDVRTKKDLDIKVTDIVDVWYSQSKGINPYTTIDNNGFIVKWTGSLEWNPSASLVPQIKFYSSDTYTIYPPELEIGRASCRERV